MSTCKAKSSSAAKYAASDFAFDCAVSVRKIRHQSKSGIRHKCQTKGNGATERE